MLGRGDREYIRDRAGGGRALLGEVDRDFAFAIAEAEAVDHQAIGEGRRRVAAQLLGGARRDLEGVHRRGRQMPARGQRPVADIGADVQQEGRARKAAGAPGASSPLRRTSYCLFFQVYVALRQKSASASVPLAERSCMICPASHGLLPGPILLEHPSEHGQIGPGGQGGSDLAFGRPFDGWGCSALAGLYGRPRRLTTSRVCRAPDPWWCPPRNLHETAMQPPRSTVLLGIAARRSETEAMTDTEYSRKLDELDRLLNDPDVPMEPARCGRCWPNCRSATDRRRPARAPIDRVRPRARRRSGIRGCPRAR